MYGQSPRAYRISRSELQDSAESLKEATIAAPDQG
jgi:hypothetical protein